VHVLNRRLRLVHEIELYEPKAAARVGGDVAADAARLHRAEAVEHALEGELVHVLCQVLDVHVRVLLRLVHQHLLRRHHHVAPASPAPAAVSAAVVDELLVHQPHHLDVVEIALTAASAGG